MALAGLFIAELRLLEKLLGLFRYNETDSFAPLNVGEKLYKYFNFVSNGC